MEAQVLRPGEPGVFSRVVSTSEDGSGKTEVFAVKQPSGKWFGYWEKELSLEQSHNTDCKEFDSYGQALSYAVEKELSVR